MDITSLPSLTDLFEGADQWREVLSLLPVLVLLELILSADNAVALAAIARSNGQPEQEKLALNVGIGMALVLRIGLIGMFAAHIHAAFSLSRMNTKANKAYAGSRDYLAVNFASRTMRWTGPIILLYLLFHLADLTWGWFSDDWVRGDVYANVYNSMDALPIALIYIAANVALAVHIFHGAWSMFQTLGLNNPRYNNARRHFARGIAGLILIGNLSFPLAVQGGLVDLDGHTPGEYNLEYGD